MTEVRDVISISAAQENRVTLTMVPAASPGEIVVTAARVRQDLGTSTTGLVVDVPATVETVPLARSATSVVLLAPGTVLGVAGFGDVASVGGSSVAENAYYINGLNITNPDTYVGASRVPFEFYQTLNIQTGGYLAEFGRATGAVVNATTKSGSNTAFMAIHGNFSPSGLSARSPNTGDPTNPATIGRLGHIEAQSITLESGGALVKDHVFVYGLVQTNRGWTTRASAAAATYEVDEQNAPFYGGKADVYLNQAQHLELTYFRTSDRGRRSDYAFDAKSNLASGAIGAPRGNEVLVTGGSNWVARYTGNITESFQLSGTYGVSEDSSDVLPADLSSYFVRDQRTATSPNGSTSIRIVSPAQPFAAQTIDETRRRFWRIDGDLQFRAAGRHHLRFGIDNEDLSEVKITQLNGALPIRYTYTNTGVQLLFERLGGNVSGRDRAYYLQDSWEPARGLTVDIGARDDTFLQRNLAGQPYLDLKDNFAVRAGMSYTPNGDSPLRLTATYGRYFIPPAMNLGFRGRDLFFVEYFNYPGATTAADNLALAGSFAIDPASGLPLSALGTAQSFRTGAGFGSPCPADLSSAPGRPVNGASTCLVLGGGIQVPARAKVASGTRATYEDEVILGARLRAAPHFSIGVSGTYRKLSRVSEDTDFAPLILEALGCGTPLPSGSAAQCAFYAANTATYIWNPGKSSVTVRDRLDPRTSIVLKGLTFPAPRREYLALTVDWKREDDGRWWWNGSVTLSRLKGNSEGTVKSDAGNAVQVDAGATQDFDYKGLTDYSYGYLPNHHALVVKSWGAVHLTRRLAVGANVQIESPMHGSCEGFHPTDSYAAGYGPSSFYCAIAPLGPSGFYTATQPSPRGSG